MYRFLTSTGSCCISLGVWVETARCRQTDQVENIISTTCTCQGFMHQIHFKLKKGMEAG